MKKILLAISAMTIAASAQAQVTVEDVTYPQTISIAGKTLQLNGAGLREIFVVDVYTAGLYTPAKAQTLEAVLKQSAPQRVRLVLLRDVDAGDFVEALNEGIQANSSDQERAAIASELTKLVEVMKKIGDVKKGDTVDFDYTTTKGVRVLMNDKVIGENIGAKALYDAVLKIWLGEKAIDADLKKALLK